MHRKPFLAPLTIDASSDPRCGCRVAGEGDDPSPVPWVAFGGLALGAAALGRRRRRAGTRG